MAGDWIKMRSDLHDDPAVYKLAEILEVDELHVVGALFCFWAWADKHAVDGHVDGATTRLVDKVSSTQGFAAAMKSVGWLIQTEKGVSIPNFDRHNGESSKERGLKNARQARWRAGKLVSVDALPSTSPSTKSPTREEKRREEEIHTSVPALDVDKKIPTAKQDPIGFTEFWQAWPSGVRKQAKGKCLEAWKKAHAEAEAALVNAHVESLKDSANWKKNDGEFIPAPLVYLNKRSWEGAEIAEPAFGNFT
jgi:hypothetical protein